MYIIGHYNSSVRIIFLVPHTTYVVCVNFIHKWWDLQFKVYSERQISWETFHGNFVYSHVLPEICWGVLISSWLLIKNVWIQLWSSEFCVDFLDEENKKNIFSIELPLNSFLARNFESKVMVTKFFTLNCRSRRSWIKLKHTTWVV